MSVGFSSAVSQQSQPIVVSKTQKNSGHLQNFLNSDTLARLQKKYISGLMEKVDRLFVLLEKKDMTGIRSIAHQLKGTGKTFGFPAVSELGKELSTCAKRSDLARLESVIKTIYGIALENSGAYA